MATFLDFEKPIAELDARVTELRDTAQAGSLNIDAEIEKLEAKSEKLLRDTYGRLTPWQKTQVARHPERPHFKDYVSALVDEFVPLAGDRGFADDQAIIGGLGKMNGRKVMLIGHEKGDDTASRLKHNFGMAKPEGYRKAIRLMHLADRFGLPVVTLVDTAGAFPGVQAEERGQAEAIARSTEACLSLSVPLVAAIVGEGGSGGAIAIAAANRVLMLEHSVYAVISPEGCASILWRTADKAADAAEAMRVTAQDLKQLGVIERIVPEPLGGAHRQPGEAIASLGAAIEEELARYQGMAPAEIRAERRAKFLAIG
ncbi:acetyl-CoA carboxylase carboxyltransferase subunit alpha [Sphingomonas sp. LY54]|uniref:acetyl-CoA carboxylase carboxyltransferase subunit alpha n=1 Tax=Sphingomonadales TaxID=204457 RepID=UPI002ADEAD94|nr:MULTISPECIES: acetyl-CoA carboxylase carboxyltransferase subunit alpha [Sphingomonadales]MEA1013106.1 acetyl-CoA carboxylase carboxyltransferase subunit alpha [Sphingosinicella sp. LY1275]WRP28516.1 acetyl-CoA carboxylase carboxyltransferase subunit alpha [Sphingomonas sp. LY54]